MPSAEIRGVGLYYEVVGETGPWVMLSPGGRRSLDEMRGLARATAASGCRVLLHDRRNTGRSAVSIEDTPSEFEVWADDGAALLRHLDAAPRRCGRRSTGTSPT